jgi:hypothetical protein
LSCPARAIHESRSCPELPSAGGYRIFEFHVRKSSGDPMKLTIAALRKQGDECLSRAELASDRSLKAEWLELSTHWHWLAGQLELDQSIDEDIELA